jgi:hypothetical protein
MEDVLDQYEKPLNPAEPVICLDEQPYQLLADTHPSEPAAPGKTAKQDYEYRRCGTCSVFVGSNPRRPSVLCVRVANVAGRTSRGCVRERRRSRSERTQLTRFRHRGSVPQGAMGTNGVVLSVPTLDQDLGLQQGVKNLSVQNGIPIAIIGEWQ